MRKLTSIIVISFLLSTPSFAEYQNREVLADLSPESLPMLNDILNNLRNTVDRRTPAYPIAVSNGGTGSSTKNFVDLTTGQTVGGVKAFTSFPTTPSSAPTTDYQAANKKYVDDATGGISSSGFSNVLLEWHGCDTDGGSDASYGLQVNTSSSVGSTAANFMFMYYYAVPKTALIRSKFIKTSGVNTVTVFARFYNNNASSAYAAHCYCLIGALGELDLSYYGTTIAWTSGTIDVSSLTNGTAYDITISLAGSGGGLCILRDIVLIGS